MSRVGRAPITVPAKVTVQIDKGNYVTVKGPKGTLTQQLNPDMAITQTGDQITVVRPTDLRHHKSLHGLTRALLNNMLTGVATGFSRKLEVQGTGYRAEKKGNKLVMLVGYSHPVEFDPLTSDMTFEVDKEGRSFQVLGSDKEKVGQMAAIIRKIRPPEPYQGKGIRYAGETVRMKAGKAGKAGKGNKK